MGGEPTFVGIDDPESAEWNLDALGPMKRGRGLGLIQYLREHVAPGALLHYGQGKWYPGEPLPRWALSCLWRVDSVPVWENIHLIARGDEHGQYDAADARVFIEALTRRLQMRSENVLAAFNAESAEPVGYVLPVRRRQIGEKLFWSSQLWFERPEQLLLTSGDSPIGYRIPTDLVPWVAPDEVAYEYDQAPYSDRVKLPAKPLRRMDLFVVEPEVDPLPAISVAPETAAELVSSRPLRAGA